MAHQVKWELFGIWWGSYCGLLELLTSALPVCCGSGCATSAASMRDARAGSRLRRKEQLTALRAVHSSESHAGRA